MSKKENDREVTSLLARIRESLRRPKKETVSEEMTDDSFDRDLSERLEKHLGTQNEDAAGLGEGDSESDFEVDQLEIVEDGVLDPDQLEETDEQTDDLPSEEEVAAAEQALFSDLDALMARMTPEQRAQFEAEMNDTEEPEESVQDEVTEDSADEPIAEETVEPEVEEAREEIVTELPETEPEVETVEVEETKETEVVEEIDYVRPEIEEMPVEEQPTTEVDAVLEDAVQENAVEDEQEGEVYTVPEEDEDYDLYEAEAFRALEARMTAEQRAQFEQALAEAQEAERAEKAARREAARLAAKERAEQEAQEAEVSCALADEPAEAEEQEIATETVEEAVEESVEETVEEPVVALEEETPWVVATQEETAEIASVEQAPTEDEGVQITLPAEIELPTETSIFMTAEEDGEDDMPTIKVGSDPSAFTLVVEPEIEHEQTEEEILADLISRMTPEQLARFREEMLADESVEDEVAPIAEEEEVFVTADENAADMADEPEDVSEIPIVEENAEYEDNAEGEDAIAAVLNDPEKLEELMSRLSPEQAEELRAMLGMDEAEEIETVEAELIEEMPTDAEEIAEVIDDAELIDEELIDEESSEPVEEEEFVDAVDSETEETFFEDEPLRDTDDGVAFEYSRSMESEDVEDDFEDEEDMNVFEITDEMSDEEIALMLGLGYEKELVYTLGAERVEQVKKRAARENARDPELANAYAYEGEEYRSTDQDERIRYRYEVERRRLWVRLIGTSVFALLLFLYECCGLFRGAFGDVFNAAHYPVIAIMTGWQLLIFASAFSWKQLLHGIRSAFVLEPDNHAMTSIVVAVVMFSNILMAIVFKGSNLYVYNFPAAICLLCSVLCDFADLTRETLTFDVISADNKKYVSEAITLTSAHTSMPIMPIEEERNNPLSSKNAMYVRRVGFVKNYFRRTNRKTHHAQILNFVFLPLLAFAIVMGVVTALIGNGIAPALSGFVVSILLCMPLSYTVIHTLPLFYEARRLHKQGCAIVGEGTVEECNQLPTVVFEDKDIFPPSLITTKGLKLYENNLIYSVILKISLLFREIGGPINEVLDLDKEEMKRFLASGRAGGLENGQVYLDSVCEDGVTARLGDGSRVVAGSASFLASHGIYVRVSEKDQKLIDSKELSILFLAFDGKLGARFYVDYRPDPEFEALAGMLHEDGFRVAIRTLDPGIHEEMIAQKCPPETPEIGTVRAKVRELTSKPGSDAKVDGGLVCSDDPRRMLLPLRAIRNLRRLNRFSLRLYAIAMLINMAVVVVLTVCSAVGFMSSLFVSLYMLVWLATSLVTTALFLNK